MTPAAAFDNAFANLAHDLMIANEKDGLTPADSARFPVVVDDQLAQAVGFEGLETGVNMAQKRIEGGGSSIVASGVGGREPVPLVGDQQIVGKVGKGVVEDSGRGHSFSFLL